MVALLSLSLSLALVSTPLFSSAQKTNQFAPATQLCQPNKLPPGWVAGKTTAPLKQVSSSQQLNPTAPIVCSGNVVILDGCNFKVDKFVFSGALQSKWYAGVVGLDKNGQVSVNQNGVVFVANDVPPSNGGSPSFTLINKVDVAYSFFSINELRLFDVAQNQLLCVVELPYLNPTADPIPGGASAVPGNGIADGGSGSAGSGSSAGTGANTTNSSGAAAEKVGSWTSVAVVSSVIVALVGTFAAF